MTTPFVIYALPRSRTYWLSRFLTYGEWTCGHEEVRHARSLEDVRAWFSQPCTGTIETAAAPWWRLVPENVRTAVIRRPVSDVVDSLARQGFPTDLMAPLMRKMDRKLDQIESRVPGCLSVTFDELSTIGGCQKVFQHCLPYSFDPKWWAQIAPVNLQANVMAMVRYSQAYQPQLDRLSEAAKVEIYAKLARGRSTEIEGVIFQQEPFGRFYADAERLIEKHTAKMGRSEELNIPMLRMLSQVGSLQVTTARSNGRIFGYIMMVIGPSMDTPDKLVATHATTYASPEIPGLGLKLARAATDALRERGVDEVLYRVGDEQTKLDAFYRRLGAAHYGHEYMLRLH